MVTPFSQPSDAVQVEPLAPAAIGGLTQMISVWKREWNNGGKWRT